MSWFDDAVPMRMRRVAVLAPQDALGDVLARVADAGAVEIGPAWGPETADPPGGAGNGTVGLEAQLAAYSAAAVRRSGTAALAGWMPASRVDSLAASLAEVGGAVVPLPSPPGIQPPTLVARPAAAAPGIAAGRDVRHGAVRRHDPAWLAGRAMC